MDIDATLLQGAYEQIVCIFGNEGICKPLVMIPMFQWEKLISKIKKEQKERMTE